jgi:hypothetical protein
LSITHGAERQKHQAARARPENMSKGLARSRMESPGVCQSR